jgi:hypothetical protein
LKTAANGIEPYSPGIVDVYNELIEIKNMAHLEKLINEK